MLAQSASAAPAGTRRERPFSWRFTTPLYGATQWIEAVRGYSESESGLL